MSTKEIGELKVMLEGISTSLSNIKESVDELKDDYKKLNDDVVSIKLEVADIKSSHKMLSKLVWGALSLGGAASLKILFEVFSQ